MRRLAGIVLMTVIFGMVWFLDHAYFGLPAIGRLIDPMNGCWANAEPVNISYNAKLTLPQMQHPATVWLDERLVPHVHAASDHDIYFLEGYIHASFRLWQMDMETRAAAGRISEVVGRKALGYDRLQRRKGMVFAAENSLTAMEADPRTKLMLDAYTEGINQYISKLRYKDYPLEYKLMSFKPEPWTNIKSALLLKYMADDLTGSPDDIPLTYLREVLSPELFQLLYPDVISGSATVIPSGTKWEKPSFTKPVAPKGNVFPHFTKQDFKESREDGIGSNNWAVSGSKTQSGAAILCNDPHLGLHLPCLWFEMQLQAPGMNVYGASLPGAPGVVIGFNDSVSWGFTNNYRDVKDYYLIKRVPGNADKYIYDGEEKAFTKRLEHIVVKGQKEVIDTVCYTLHGPVTYDEHNKADGGFDQPLAMCWTAHRATNEYMAFYIMNRATNYNTFVDGILNFQCPGQNMAYADRAGNIALWGQGQFVNKWKGQGQFIMDGSDKATLWGDLIPMRENPHVFNPAQGYVASANECVTDSTYPYWYNGDFVELRAWRLNQLLAGAGKVNIQDMMAMQNDNYSVLASKTLPIMLRHLHEKLDGGREASYIERLQKWDYRLSAEGIEGSLYQVWWFYLYNKIWSGFSNVPDLHYPLPERTMQLLIAADSTTNNIPQLANLDELMKISFRRAMDSLAKRGRRGLEWYKVKSTSAEHLTKLPAFSFNNLKIGGWGNTLNAAKPNHGPSWRMIVQMGKEIEAYGVYPGGQSGNP
ncbi:MAG: penicillin acylase family protein, partial [Taibaiella sp.]|nr:penicillin acylase family protein [Taibaiella sp.]